MGSKCRHENSKMQVDDIDTSAYDEVVGRFIGYSRIDTTTNKEAGAALVMPSNPAEFTLANLICDELRAIGLVDVKVSDRCMVTGRLEARLPKEGCKNSGKNSPKGGSKASLKGAPPTIAFCAHLDTSSECSGATKVQILRYEGVPLELGHGIVLSEDNSLELARYRGQELLVSDGASLLGADDKAGLAAIVQALSEVAKDKQPHGEVRVLFVPDEEQGLRGSKAFVNDGYADFGYCLDAGGLGEFCYENWNAGNVTLTFHGQSAHPMSAKGKLINSLLLAHKFISLLPAGEAPEYTCDKEGYYWVKEMSGNSAKTLLKMDIRDFSLEGLKERASFLKRLADGLNAIYGRDCARFSWEMRYENVNNLLAPPNDAPIALALAAYKTCGIEPDITPMRGGYDGAVLSSKGLPCPNIFTGAHNFHSVYEFCPINSLIAAKEVVKNIIWLNAKD